MAKLTLNTIGSRYGSIDALNDNFDAIETALENTFSLDGTSPNALEADLDMNSNDILNAGEINTDTLRINGVLVEPGTGVNTGAIFQTYQYTATAGQTIFSVAPAIPQLASISVFVNGLSLPPSEVSVNSTNVILPAMTVGDEIVIRRYTSDITGSYISPDLLVVDRFTANGTTTLFTLSASVATGGTSLNVYINGVYQNQNTYTISGSSLSFTQAPPATSVIECVFASVQTVTSLNANGVLNYIGTWNASTNTPAIAGTGTKGDFYVVSVAGSTNLDGISTWSVGDWASYNGTVWQRIAVGVDVSAVNLSVSGVTTLSALTASTALALNASKQVVSVTNTGTGNNVLATSPTITSPVFATDTTHNYLTASSAIATDANKKLVSVTNTGTGSNVLATSPVLVTPSITGNATLSTGNITQGTAAKGVNFTANTPAAGMTSQLLNWYEEGTWTPTFGSLTIVGTPTYTGKYTRIGRQVTFTIRVTSTTSTASSFGTTFFNLPFAAAANPSTLTAVQSVATATYSVGLIYTDGNGYPPTWAANSDVTISGTYFV